MDEQRPDPEELLKQIKQEEIAKQRGKLKIFFGLRSGCWKDLCHVGSSSCCLSCRCRCSSRLC